MDLSDQRKPGGLPQYGAGLALQYVYDDPWAQPRGVRGNRTGAWPGEWCIEPGHALFGEGMEENKHEIFL